MWPNVLLFSLQLLGSGTVGSSPWNEEVKQGKNKQAARLRSTSQTSIYRSGACHSFIRGTGMGGGQGGWRGQDVSWVHVPPFQRRHTGDRRQEHEASAIHTWSFHYACVHESGKSCLRCGVLVPVPISLPVSVPLFHHGRGLAGSSLPVLLGFYGFEFPGVLVALVMGLCLVLKQTQFQTNTHIGRRKQEVT